MTLEEKASLLSGANFWNTRAIERLNIPSIMLTDGPHGLRKQAGKADHLGLGASVPATCFPTAAALANSWDEKLTEAVGRAIGAEAAANNVNVLLGPGLNIVRDPLAGRAFEYFSEDPYIAGKLAASMVRGIQSTGVAATPKHFAVNSQEHMRMSIDEVVDERTMREIYLEGFRRVVQESNPKMLMTSYNKVNGVYANENAHLLQTILRDEWKYSGAVVTDWGGNHDPAAGVAIGGALEMPASNGLADTAIIDAVNNGSLAVSILDQRVDTFLKLVFETTSAIKNAPKADLAAHHALAVEAAVRSLVLLKNEAQLLPLPKATKVALIGDFAKTPRYQGAGSSLVHPTQLVSALDAFTADDSLDVIGYEPGFKRIGGKSNGKAKRAVSLAKKADVVVLFLGLDESKEAEGIDRQSMALSQNQLEIVQKICVVHSKVVVVLAAGGPVEIPFAEDVEAIIHGSLGGQAIGSALVDVITGRRNPSGKLAVTFPLQHADTPASRYFPGKERTAEHREGLYVGYRYYETTQTPVRYPFGYGLSYTTFEYANLQVEGNGASISITNTGNSAGDEVVQLYVNPPQTDIFRPVRELKAFARVSLQPGETKQIQFAFDDHTFAYYDTLVNSWKVATGEYEIEVGASVRDIRAKVLTSVQGSEITGVSYDKQALEPYFTGRVSEVSDEAFRTLLDRTVPAALWDRKARLTYDDTIAQLQYGGVGGRLFYGILRGIRRILFVFKKPYLANNVVFVMNLPFSKIPNFSGGKISERLIKRLLRIKLH